jgi:hypothetical protein
MVVVLSLGNSPSAKSIVQQVRTLQRVGLITEAHCLRAELYIERHFEVFCDSTHITVRQAAEVAVGYTAFAI